MNGPGDCSEPRLTEERGKAEIKNSALRCRDETKSFTLVRHEPIILRMKGSRRLENMVAFPAILNRVHFFVKNKLFLPFIKVVCYNQFDESKRGVLRSAQKGRRTLRAVRAAKRF